MSSLKISISKKGYTQIPIVITKTNHMVIKVKLNGVKGRFILDTGASNSCLDTEQVEHFKVQTTDSKIKASGAGAVGMETLKSEKNRLKMSSWKTSKCNLIIFDMSHVNQALAEYNAKPIQGIIGADILIQFKGIIDYKRMCFYLKKK